MGCDIHGYIEVREGGSWRELLELPMVRDYDMFGLLAGVRNYVNAIPIADPKGFPEDASTWAKMEYKNGEYYHDASYLTYAEIQAYNWDNKSMDGRISEIDVATGKEGVKASYTWLQDHPEEAKALGVELRHLERVARDLIPLEYEALFEAMKFLSGKLGAENVRMAFWFDN